MTSFNDSPISKATDDLFGVTPFAKAIAQSLLNIEKPVGSTIALNGAWGSGKSSVVNIIRSEVDGANDVSIVASEFKCWWFKGEEALTLAFLQHLFSLITPSLSSTGIDALKKISKRVLQAGPVIGAGLSAAFTPLIGTAVSASSRYLEDLISKDPTIEKLFQSVSEALAEEHKRFLIIIDDIDRLSADEAIAVFRIVKSFGRLPNVMYLLVFDRTLVETAVDHLCPSEGPHFLEKIVQASFDIPPPLQADLNNAVLSIASEIFGELDEEKQVRFFNLFYDVVVPYITTPRHVARLRNGISVTWPAIKGEVDCADFLAMETLRLYEAGLFSYIIRSQDEVCGTRRSDDRRSHSDRLKGFLERVPAERREIASTALQRIFPKLEETTYSHDFIDGWDADRRVCIETHFETYSRLALGEDNLSKDAIDRLIDRAGDAAYVKEAFLSAAGIRRRTGKSKVPVLFDALMSNSKRVSEEHVEPLVSTLFAIHDELDLKQDREDGFSTGSNPLRLHWLLRRLLDSFPQQKRSEILLNAIQSAPLDWIIDLAMSMWEQHHPREGKKSARVKEELVTSDAAESMRQLALSRIRQSAGDGELAKHRDLVGHLFRWRDFCEGDATEAMNWSTELLKTDDGVVALAKSMLSESWSAAMGGFGSLGDRVARKRTTVGIRDDYDIFDVREFRRRLEEIKGAASLGEDSLKVVSTFLEVWSRSKNSVDDD